MEILENPGGPDITETLSEEVAQSTEEKATDIKADDFIVDTFDVTEKKPDDKKPEPKKEEVKAPDNKTKAVSRLAKPSTMVAFADIVLVRVGAIFSKRPREYWKLSGEDKEDLSLLLQDTINEGNFSGIPAKWLLLGVVALIILGKVLNMNNPDYQPSEKKQVDQVKAEAELKLKYSEEMDTMRENIESLANQNKQILDLLRKGNNEFAEDVEIISETKKPDKLYKGYDLDKISFTPNGALVDPSKAGEKGYNDDGTKVGNISKEHKDVHRQWKVYKQFKKSKEYA